MDFVAMVEGASLFSAGPPLVEAATGEVVDKESLGGATLHTQESGVAHNRVEDDRAALDLVRRYLSYFPTSSGHTSPVTPGPDGERTVPELLDAVPADPRQPYDVRDVLRVVADHESMLEIAPDQGRTIVTALARLGGRPVAVVANQPAVRAGAIDVPGADKAARFLETVGPFGLPVLFLADNPGVMAGSAAERAGMLRHAARMFRAQSTVRGPKLHVTLRKAYGFGSSLMGMNPFDGQTVVLALPGARLGAMPAESGGEAARLEPDVRDLLANAELGGAYSSADTVNYDDVVAPDELRNRLLGALRLSSARG
jgi:acetyl-CoA carboxylase carboxyltransferase component